MILSFGCKHTEKVWNGEHTAKWTSEIKNRTLRKLFMLNAATSLQDLRMPPSNRLHKLKGDLSAFYSISVNDQWRVIFRWKSGDAFEVQLIDYH